MRFDRVYEIKSRCYKKGIIGKIEFRNKKCDIEIFLFLYFLLEGLKGKVKDIF